MAVMLYLLVRVESDSGFDGGYLLPIYRDWWLKLSRLFASIVKGL